MIRRLVAGIAMVLVMSACADGGPPAGGSEQEVQVTIRDSRFVPDHFEFAAGTEVTFVVENTDPIDHEFIIGNEDVQQAHEEGTETHHGSKPGELSIPIGETLTTTFTFDEPGTLLIGCHLPSHYDYGMRGDIAITD